MDNVLYLIAHTKAQDKTGVWRTTDTRRQVYCQVKSVTQNEFFEGGRNGLNPEYQFTVFRADYEGETVLEFEGKNYAVYRTYLADSDYIELYAERQGGTNG